MPLFPNDEYTTLTPLSLIPPSKVKVYNRLERNFELCSKKRLFSNLVTYYKSLNKDPFEHIPLTFHIQTGPSDPNFQLFKQKFLEIQEKIDAGLDSSLTNC